MGDNKISEASLPVVARYVGKTSNIYRYIAEDLAVVDAQIADEAHLQGEAVPVGYRWRHSAGEKWQYSDVPCGWEHEPLFTHPQPAELNEVSGNSGELGESASIVDLLDVIAPFAHFALVRSALGNTAPKGGTVYSVCTTLGDAEISAEDFEAAFNAIARNTEAV